MANIKKIKIGDTSYDIKDASAVHPSDLATVATSGSYNDLTNKPTIPSYTFSTGLTNTSGTVTVTDYNKLAKNTATGDASVAYGSSAVATGDGCVALGDSSSVTNDASTAIGYNASCTAGAAIQLGQGTNSTDYSFQVGFESSGSFQLLNGITGLIPDERISSNIARTSAIPTVNNSTITIQKNGATVDSFTTNASSGKTINITVPTTASDVGAVPTTGGTLTGNLLISKASPACYDAKNTDMDAGVVPSTDRIFSGAYRFYDKNGLMVGQTSNYISPTGDIGTSLFSQNGTASASFEVLTRSDNTAGVSASAGIRKDIASWAFPSTSAITLFDSNNTSYNPVPASSTSFTASDYGYITFLHRVATAGSFIGLVSNFVCSYQTAHTNNQLLRVTIPVIKGATVTIEYSSSSTSNPVSNIIFVKAGAVA